MIMEKLNVFLHNQLAGYLLWDKKVLSFEYDKSYIAEKYPLPISVSLPLSGSFDTKAVETFFPDCFLTKYLKNA